MRGKIAKSLRKIVLTIAHSKDNTTTQGALQSQVPEDWVVSPRLSNVVKSKNHGNIFVQRLLDPNSMKRLVKNFKRQVKHSPGPLRATTIKTVEYILPWDPTILGFVQPVKD